MDRCNNRKGENPPQCIRTGGDATINICTIVRGRISQFKVNDIQGPYQVKQFSRGGWNKSNQPWERRSENRTKFKRKSFRKLNSTFSKNFEKKKGFYSKSRKYFELLFRKNRRINSHQFSSSRFQFRTAFSRFRGFLLQNRTAQVGKCI